MSSGLQIAASPELADTLSGKERRKKFFGNAKENASQSEDLYSGRIKFQRQTSQHQQVPQTRQAKFLQAGQKRRASFGVNDGKYLGNKRKKKDTFLPATKFLLGGSITDPLNLGSLADEEINRSLNESTPKTSPLPTPRHKMRVEVLIPPNINDPLNLSAGNDAGDIELNLISPKIRKRKNKKGKKQSAGDATGNTQRDSEEDEDVEAKKTSDAEFAPREEKKIKTDHESPKTAKKRQEDKIVSPVVVQPRIWKPPPLRKDADAERREGEKIVEKQGTQKKAKNRFKEQESKKNSEVFRYGNYNRYYGYRNPNEPDYRISLMKKEWFENKSVLDVGCNVGYVTLHIARDFSPNLIVGVDIDQRLINVARKNVKHYSSCSSQGESKFPISLPICHGPLASREKEQRAFPFNVTFQTANYVLERDELLDLQIPQFHTILCLSLTKWVHLNWGDDGLKRLFKRMFLQLHPGGILLLESQSWRSYCKKKKLTPVFSENIKKIRLRPEMFAEYLKSKEVGFESSYVVDVPYNQSRGFRRPLLVFTKPGVVSIPKTELPATSTSGSAEESSEEKVKTGSVKQVVTIAEPVVSSTNTCGTTDSH